MEKKVGKIGEIDIIAFTLKNNHGMEVTLLNYGGRITSIKVPDRAGVFEEIVIGYSDIENYFTDEVYFGAICGRVAGRIRSGKFSLGQREFRLTQNDGNNHLHGGKDNFSHAIWQAKPLIDRKNPMLCMSYTSKDGEEGYPAELVVDVVYELTEDNRLIITYYAKSSNDTVVNLTNHTYFNLSGGHEDTILSHQLQIDSEVFLEIDEQALPTGNLLQTKGTPFYLCEGGTIGEKINKSHEQLEIANQGYNHAFVLKGSAQPQITLIDSQSGRQMRVQTDAPCAVVYTASYFDESLVLGEKRAGKYVGICLETQGFPDAINHGHFPSIILRKNEYYQTKTTYQFSVVKGE